MGDVSGLPAELAASVLRHEAAMAVQHSVRRHFLRHCRRTRWPALRARLLQHATTREFDALARREWIRREWRHEPHSWEHMLTHTPHRIRELLYEAAFA